MKRCTKQIGWITEQLEYLENGLNICRTYAPIDHLLIDGQRYPLARPEELGSYHLHRIFPSAQVLKTIAHHLRVISAFSGKELSGDEIDQTLLVRINGHSGLILTYTSISESNKR